MKPLYKTLAISLLLIPALSFAADDENCEKKDHSAMKSGMMGKMSMMTPEQKKQHMRSMQAHMLQMHDYANKILAEKDPLKAQKLKDEQLELMQAHMMKMMAHKQKMKEKHHKMMKKEK
ncbi:MAG: hypothetical protein GQ569_06785 [Methylococcaceae bacterium]|nr:hypothetical protein [Methylococcaceae bacterium]